MEHIVRVLSYMLLALVLGMLIGGTVYYTLVLAVGLPDSISTALLFVALGSLAVAADAVVRAEGREEAREED